MSGDRFRDVLLAERRRVESAIGHVHEENPQTIREETEEQTFDNHPADAATVTVNREIDSSLGENAERVLAAIDRALARIEDGTYGACARCGREIAEQRLEAIPHTDKCIDCQRLEERG